MLIWQHDGIRVLQHPYLSIFSVQQWMEGDDPRTYGRKYDYFTVEQCRTIGRVRDVVANLMSEKHERT